jgi:hypothetical protein
MRAVLIATGENPGLSVLTDGTPAPLLPLLDRSLLEYQIAVLVRQGFRRIDLILCHFPEQIEALLGEGSRWGCRLVYHLVRDPAKWSGPLRSLLRTAGPLLLGDAALLPSAVFADEMPSPSSPDAVAYCPPGGEWSGWAWLTPACQASLAGEGSPQGLGPLLLAGGARRVDTDALYDALSLEGYVRAQGQVLETPDAAELLSGRCVAPGVWLRRNVSLHPSAVLVPPVFSARIAPSARA